MICYGYQKFEIYIFWDMYYSGYIINHQSLPIVNMNDRITGLVIGKVYSGKEFNNLTKSVTLVKLTVESENHNNFQYQTGLNVDGIPFNPHGSCSPGGLYFCKLEYFPRYLHYYDKFCVNLRYVSIPD